MTFAHFLRGFFKEDAIASRDGRSRQLCVFIVTAAKQPEKFSLFLLGRAAAGSRSRAAGSRAGRLLQSRVDARAQFLNRTLEPIHIGGIKLFCLVVLRF